jgi:xylose dehydrogenase (NAD/NADP)
LKPEFAGGCLWDVGVYPLSFAQFVMGGPPQWVAGSQWLGESGVDEVFAGQLYYGGGRVAHIASSFKTPFQTRIEIIGTRGRLVLERPFVHVQESQPMFYPASGEPEPLDVPEEYLYLGEIEDMQRAILDGQPHYLTPAETRHHVRTVLALYQAAREKRVVRLDEFN